MAMENDIMDLMTDIMAMENDFMALENDYLESPWVIGVDGKQMDLFKELHRKATIHNMGESGSSSSQVEACSEDFEMPSIIVSYGTEYEVIVTNAVEVFNLFQSEFFGSDYPFNALDKVFSRLYHSHLVYNEVGPLEKASGVVDEAQLVCNRVILYASMLSRISGKDENIVMYLEQVIEYMEKNPWAGSPELRCLLFYACAKVFKKQGHMDKALRSCYSAREAAQFITNFCTSISMKFPLEVAISLLLVEINGIHGDPEPLLLNVNHFLRLQPILMSWIDLVGFIREIPEAVASDPRMTICMIGALVLALSTDYGIRNCTPILLCIGMYYDNINYLYPHHASQMLVEQAIIGLQQEECTCRSDCIVYPSTFYQEKECACHQLLAEAWYRQGYLQQDLGLSEGAEQSFQQGLKLSESCKDKSHQYVFHYRLYQLLESKLHSHGTYVPTRIVETPKDNSFQLSGVRRFHFLEYLKIAESPKASRGKDMAIAFLQAFRSLKSKSNTLELLDMCISITMEFLKKMEISGDYKYHGSLYVALSSICILKGDIMSAREHFLLGLKHWKEGGAGKFLIYTRQILGQIALTPEIMELDHAYDLWYGVYNWTQRRIKNIAHINKEDALRYFETVKRASVSLAKCEIWKLGKSVDPAQIEKIEELITKSPLEYYFRSFKPLMWAERGKGNMIMSYIGALQKNFDTKVED